MGEPNPIDKFIRQVSGVRYPTSSWLNYQGFMMLLGFGTQKSWKNEDWRNDTFFCSGMICFLLYKAGMFPNELLAPGDFDPKVAPGDFDPKESQSKLDTNLKSG